MVSHLLRAVVARVAICHSYIPHFASCNFRRRKTNVPGLCRKTALNCGQSILMCEVYSESGHVISRLRKEALICAFYHTRMLPMSSILCTSTPSYA